MRRISILLASAIVVLGLSGTVAHAQGSRNAGIQPININPKGLGSTVGQNPNQNNNNNAARAQQDLNRLNSMQRMLMPNALNQQQQLQQQQAGGAPGAMAGVLTGTERFLRENREPGSFVGAADPMEFIGASTEAMEIIAPPAEDLLPMLETLPETLNTPAPAAPSPQRPYEPRMVVGFDFAPPPSPAISAVLTDQLRALPGIDPANRIEVSVAMGIATLRGEAVSERDRALAERLLMFEPGISAVKNELKVRPLAAAPTANPPAARPPAERSPSDRNFR